MGQNKLLSVSSSVRVKSLDLKTYSSFFVLSLNVPFVLQKVSLQDFFFFSQTCPAAFLLCCRVPRNAFDWAPIWDAGFWLALCVPGQTLVSPDWMSGTEPPLLLKDLTPCGRKPRVWCRIG